MNRLLNDRRGSWSMIGMLITVAIIMVLVGILYLGLGKKQDAAMRQQIGTVAGSTKTTVPGLAEDAARNEACKSNLRQLRDAVTIFQTTNGSFPPSLDAAGIKTPDLLKCPVGGESYQYDPSTGAVTCARQGHGKF